MKRIGCFSELRMVEAQHSGRCASYPGGLWQPTISGAARCRKCCGAGCRVGVL